MYRIRTPIIGLLPASPNVEVLEHFTGFGLYDRSVVEQIRANFRDPYPYFRGMIAELGLPIARFSTTRNAASAASRRTTSIRSTTSRCWASRISPRCRCAWSSLAVYLGLVQLCARDVFYLAYKLFFWTSFTLGLAPVVLGLFFLGSVQLIALGIIGEYVGSIHTLVLNRPLVEKATINF